MDFEILEKTIADYINAQSNENLNAQVLPEKLSEYKKPQETALVSVLFTGEKADDTQSTNEVSHHTTLTFEVNIQSRWLRGEKGVYKVAQFLKNTLTGWQLANCGRLYYVSFDYSKVDLDLWEYSLTFSCRSLIAQAYFQTDYPDDTDAYLKQADVWNQGNIETVFKKD